MYILGLGIALFGYLIFIFGQLSLLYKQLILIFILFYIILFYIVFRIRIYKYIVNFIFFLKSVRKNRISILLLCILAAQALVNFIGAIGPELGFDALWYHLTIPKIYLEQHRVYFIDNGLLYYSAMPKLAELLYLAGLTLNSEIYPKLFHYFFGLLTAVLTYKIARKYSSINFSLLAALIFYSNLVVGWESISAYVDLVWSFYITLTFCAIYLLKDKKSYLNIILFALLAGFSYAVKILSVIFLPIYIFYLYKFNRKNPYDFINKVLLFLFIYLITIFPWLIFSYMNTGNPVYPLFSVMDFNSMSSGITGNLINTMVNFFKVFSGANDPISPIYLILLPWLFIFFSKINSEVKELIISTGYIFLFWFVFLYDSGNRFLIPLLPIFSVISVVIIQLIKIKSILRKYLLTVILVLVISSIFYRAIANFKFLPVIFGFESKSKFLEKNLNFNYGDFYDVDNYFEKNIKNRDKVLLIGFHNLFYINFNFITYKQSKELKEEYNFIAIQNQKIPFEFTKWNEVYYNPLTKVKLYKQ